MASTLEAMQERLKDMKQYLLDENRNAKPSKTYISDLTLSIAQVEGDIASFKPYQSKPYEIIK